MSGDPNASGASRSRRPSTLRSRNITLHGRRTSLRLEQPMWDALEEICRRERCGLSDLCARIDEQRRESTLTAAIRVFILLYYRQAATERGHSRAGHGPRGGISSLVGAASAGRGRAG